MRLRGYLITWKFSAFNHTSAEHKKHVMDFAFVAHENHTEKNDTEYKGAEPLSIMGL